MPKTQIMLIVPLMLFLFSGCGIHKIDIQQGNVITPEAVEKLKIGMNRRTVKSILGTPPLNDPFHRDRWDYVYSMELGRANKSQSSHITLLFEQDKLKDIIILKPPIPEKDMLKPEFQRR